MAEFPRAPLKRVLLDAGAKRVSEDAAEELKKEVIKWANDLSKKAVQEAKKAGRKTVQEQDILRASRAK